MVETGQAVALAPHRSAHGEGPGRGQERGHGGPEAGPGQARAAGAAEGAGGPDTGLEAGQEAGQGLEGAVEAASQTDGRGAGLDTRGELEAGRRPDWGSITRYVTSIPLEMGNYYTWYRHRILYDEEDGQDEEAEGGDYWETALSDVD